MRPCFCTFSILTHGGLNQDFQHLLLTGLFSSVFLFFSFQAIPFLLELRSVLDWVCTDTTLTLYHWLKMEDIYANIYVLKCYRESEKVSSASQSEDI